MGDPIDELLRDSLDPDPGFAADLEALLGQAFDGDVHEARVRATRRRARVVAVAASIALVGAGLTAIALTAREPRPTSIVTVPSTSTPTTPSSTPTVLTTAPNHVPLTSLPLPTTTTSPGPSGSAIVVDLDAPPVVLTPTRVMSLQAHVSETTPRVAAAPGNRIAAYDPVQSRVLFYDALTRALLTELSVERSMTDRVLGEFFVGPDDVLYLDEHIADRSSVDLSDESQRPVMIAYAATGGVYREVARRAHTTTDGWIFRLRDGIALGGDEPFQFVGPDGERSGATLDIPDVTVGPDPSTWSTAGRSWTLDLRAAPGGAMASALDCSLCHWEQAGANGTIVVTLGGSAASGERVERLMILGDEVTVYDPDGWTYVGMLDDRLLFTRIAGPGMPLEVGTFVTR